jgi:hypothetical protein
MKTGMPVKEKKRNLVLIQTLEKPVVGYWDGGMKDTFHWRIDPYTEYKENGRKFISVGSWGANYRFPVIQGRTAKQTLGNARRKLTALAKGSGIKCTFEYYEERKDLVP